MKKILTAIVLSLSLLASPAYAKKKKQLTPMEIQAIQSREFETTKDLAFGAVMTVIQDLGYTVQSADLNSGFISAASPNENKTNFWEAFGGNSSSGNTNLTAFIQQLPNTRTRVRLNFVNTKNTSTGFGRQMQQDRPVLDAQPYQVAWDKIDESLFVMGAILTPANKPVSGTDAGAPTETTDQSSGANDVGSVVEQSGKLPE